MASPRTDGNDTDRDDTPDGDPAPDRERRRPKLSLFLAGLLAVDVGIDLYDDGTVSWFWLAVGAVAWAAAAGPLASSAVGRRVGAWFRSIGIFGRGVVIVGFAAATWWLMGTFDPPTLPIESLVFGGMVGLILQVLWEMHESN
ncbi:hypothetical protein [Halorussus sp. MSC15.2]|uniref:hypothetical protein n=1 Tax=Halorussus sp. MSC15.2 TaxID=2283638 RepID=UPI0013D880B7|nr:hypothetical protein [Halorussus sp. MSC15.2]NEU55744.1 hypothetical protein [Halorussus sp. MSC15.2]